MASSKNDKKGDDEPKVNPEALKAVYAVHICYAWPQGKPGRLVPAVIANNDRGKIKKGQPLTGLVGWKATIHFSMGGIFPDTNEGSINDRRRAILLPLDKLLPHATTIHSEDIVVIGEFAVPDGAIVITPGEAADEAWLKGGKYTHVKLNGTETIMSAVERIINEKQAKAEVRMAWKLHPQSNTHDLVAKVGGDDSDDWVVDDMFFESLLKQLDPKKIRWAAFAQSPLGFVFSNKQFMVFSKAADDLKRSYRDSCAELKELVQEIGNKLSTDFPQFAPYWKDLQERAKQILKSKMTPDAVTTLLFTETGNLDDVANHMATWLVKARYISKGTITAVTFPSFRGLTALEAKNYLFEIGMIHDE